MAPSPSSPRVDEILDLDLAVPHIPQLLNLVPSTHPDSQYPGCNPRSLVSEHLRTTAAVACSGRGLRQRQPARPSEQPGQASLAASTGPSPASAPTPSYDSASATGPAYAPGDGGPQCGGPGDWAVWWPPVASASDPDLHDSRVLLRRGPLLLQADVLNMGSELHFRVCRVVEYGV